MIAEPNTLLRPSDDLDELRGQLVREMKLLDGEPEGGEPELFRSYLHHAQAQAWQGVAEGRMNAPRTVLGLLECARPFIDVHLPDLEGAAAAAAEIHFAIESLHVAVEALEERRVEDHLAKEPSGTERAILKVLAGNRTRYLRRGDVHSRLDLSEPPTPARVGQILVELHDKGLLLRIHGRAQGSPNAAFYALSARGLEICGNLGLIPEEEKQITRVTDTAVAAADAKEGGETKPAQMEALTHVLQQALSLLTDANVPRDWRSILAGLIANSPPTEFVRNSLAEWLSRSPYDEYTEGMVRMIYNTWEHRASTASDVPVMEKVELLKDLIGTVMSTCEIWKANPQPQTPAFRN